MSTKIIIQGNKNHEYMNMSCLMCDDESMHQDIHGPVCLASNYEINYKLSCWKEHTATTEKMKMTTHNNQSYVKIKNVMIKSSNLHDNEQYTQR